VPHHPDVLKHPDVCLPDLVRDRLAEVQRQQQAIEERLLEMRRADDELSQLQEATAGFDAGEYDQMARLIAERAAIPGLAKAVAGADATARRRRQDANVRYAEVTAAELRVRQFAESRLLYAEIDRIQRELDDLAAATDDLSAQALTTRHAFGRIEADLRQQQGGSVFARLRGRGKSKGLRSALDARQQQATDLERRARDSRELLDRRRSQAEAQARQLAAETTCSRADIDAADAALALARQAHARADAVARQAEADLSSMQQALLAAEARPEPTEAQRALVEDAERHQWPTLAARAADLHAQITAAGPDRNRLEAEYAVVQQRFDRLRMDAEGEIIRRAQVVATTLARLRTSKALMDGPYDVVLVDEVGAANLPEILLAVSRAKRAAVLLGDFLQLSPITNTEVENASMRPSPST
jgi:AAA domain